MKKSIALLITLLFTTVISILFLKNFTDTNSFVKEINKEENLTQSVLLIKSFQHEVMDYFSKNKEIYDNFSKSELNCVDLPLVIKDIGLTLNVCSLSEVIDINDNSIENNNKIQAMFQKNNMNYYSFSNFLSENDYKNIKNYKELNSILDSYIKHMNIENKEVLKQFFTTLKIKVDNKYLKCKLKLTKENYSYLSSFIININNKEVSNFEFSFN